MPLINALLPLIRPLQVTSLNPFSVTSSSPNYFPSKRLNAWSGASILFLILLISHVIFDSDFYAESQTSSIGKRIIFIKLCSIRLAHLTILVESFRQRRNLIEMIDTLSLIDCRLAKELGVEVGHKDLQKLVLKCLVIGSAVLISIECSVLAIFLNHSSITFISFWIARLFSLSVICLRYLQIISFIYIIQSRLSLINSNLNRIDTETVDESHEKLVSIIGHLAEDNRDVCNRQTKKFTNFDEITILRDLYGKLYDVSKLINTCFGTSLLVCVGNDFGTVTLNGYSMYLSYKESKNVAIIGGTALWSTAHIMCSLLIAGFCYSTVSKANETAVIVHKIDNNSVHAANVGLRTRIQQFSLQLLHQKPAFNACGFFDINFTLIYTILGAITTYLVILIQFQMSS